MFPYHGATLGIYDPNIKAPHDKLGQNGSTGTYIIVERLYYWKGPKNSVNKHVKLCMTCQKRNIQAIRYAQLQFLP